MLNLKVAVASWVAKRENSKANSQEQQMIMNTCLQVSKTTFPSAEGCFGFLSAETGRGAGRGANGFLSKFLLLYFYTNTGSWCLENAIIQIRIRICWIRHFLALPGSESIILITTSSGSEFQGYDDQKLKKKIHLKMKLIFF